MNPTPDTSRKTILLVDDEIIIALDETRTLENNGFSVITAVSGEEAVDIARRRNGIDLVLMDIDLGRGMDGTEAAEIIIRERDIPIIFLSSHTERAVVEKTEGITSYGYVVKNSGETVLMASIKMAFRLHRAHLALREKNEEVNSSNEELQAAIEELESTNEELMRSQNDLFESAAYQKQIIDNAPFGAHFYRLDLDGRLIFTGANRAADRILGIDHTQLTGKSIEEAFPGLVATDIPRIYRDIAAKGTTYEHDQVEYDEGEIFGAFEIRAFRTVPGRMAVFFTNITERKKTESELKNSQKLYESLVETAQDLVWRCDAEGKYVFLNRACEKIYGYASGEMLGRPFSDFMDAQTAGRDRALFTRLLIEDGIISNHESIHTRKDGKPVLLLFNARVITDEGGRVIGTQGTARDITALKKTEWALLKSEEKLRSIFRAAPTGIGMTVNRIFMEANDRLCEMSGYTREELLGQNALMLYVTREEYEYVGREKYRQIAETGTGTVETRWRKKDGTLIDVLLSSTPIEPGDTSRGVTFTALDITRRLRTEEALRESEERFRFLAENMGDIVWTLDLDMKTTYVSPSIEKILGFTIDERKAMPPDSLMTRDSLARAREALQTELEREKTGDIDPDRIVTIEVEYFHKNGSTVWMENSMKAIRNATGKMTGIYGVSRDITKRKQAEEALAAALEEKTALLKELQHRVKNSLTMITSLVGLESEQATEPSTKEALENLKGRIGTLANLYAMLYSGGEQKEIRLDRYLREITTSLMTTYSLESGRVKLRQSFAEVSIDAKKASSFGLILNELVTNAFKYAFPGGRTGYIGVSLGREEGGLVLKVEDDGCGPPEGFDMVKTRGLGLVLVRMLAKQLGGEAEFRRGDTTSFIVRTKP